MELGQLVRGSCRARCEAASLVMIDDDRLAAYATTLVDPLAALQGAPEQETSSSLSPTAAEAEWLAARVLTLDAVNFGSGYHDVIDKEAGRSGARTMAFRWERHLAGVTPSPAALRDLTAADCASIFGQSLAHPDQAELMALFATGLADLGTFVIDRFNGSYRAVVEAAAGSAQDLAVSLLAMPLYRDRWTANGHDIHFYKRAQITAADLARAFDHRPPARFGDLAALTAFADNLVPHVLRLDGVLVYDPELARHIDGGRRLALGSTGELEIRAAGVEAVERLVTTLAGAGHNARAMDVDEILWARGGGPSYKAVPRHRTRCAFY